MKAILLRFDAPLVSFGGPAVDHNRVVQPYPALSMLTGLIANALGWDHRDYERLNGLQERLRYAARIDRSGAALVDYQTVDLGQDWMLARKAGWTTRGRIAERGGDPRNATGTHQRLCHYRADSIHTLASVLVGEQDPTIEDIVSALREPARPLFIGRKCCLPAGPILVGVVETDSLVSALATTPRARRANEGRLQAWWWEGDDSRAASGESRVFPTSDERDWLGGVHVGRRLMREGHVDPPEPSHV